tara:strand:+ start:412 stop:603 length:192 start_codon:yes stop_codon:yes gene_type:complete
MGVNKININNTQRKFILKAIFDIYTLYDFENTTEKEFKEVYGKGKKDLIREMENLKEEIKGLK